VSEQFGSSLAARGANQQLVADIARARGQRSRRWRVQFLATWAVIVAGLVAFILVTVTVDSTFLQKWIPFILVGVPITLFLAVSSIFFATILAALGALGRISRNPYLNGIASFYVSFFRGTPLLLQILFIYLALPQAGIVLPAIPTAIVALSLNYGSYMTEVFRSGIEAVPHGQIEAAESLGMTPRTTFRRIIAPQAFRIVTPAVGNDFVAMIKDSSLASVVGVQEILWRAQTAGRPTFQSMQTLLVAAFVYWVLTIIFSLFQGRLERRMATGDRTQGRRP
jgi:amine acid ABC transporter, permease protein, 3-TM region, His/Glu/Gln/Arg/opine family